MRFPILMLAGTLTTLGFAAPAAAQTANTRVVTIYGGDDCPTSSNNEEIVVCRRLPETERFRIPLDIRDPSSSPEATAQAVRNERLVSGETEAVGIGSCTTVGPGGGIGCNQAAQRRVRNEKREDGERPGIVF